MLEGKSFGRSYKYYRATFGSKLWLGVQTLQLVTSSHAPDISMCFVDRGPTYQIYFHPIYVCALFIEGQLHVPDSYISVLYS